MNRLTTDETYCLRINCDAELDGCGGTCDEYERWKRLQAYEQTGLEPETIRGVVQSILNLESVKGFDYLKSLVNADAEGRLIVMPAKSVYVITCDAGPNCDMKCPVDPWDEALGCDMCSKSEVFIYERPCTERLMKEIGHGVFLTREEAEAALAKEGDGNV